MSRRPVRYSAQEILYYLDGNFAILVPWVREVFFFLFYFFRGEAAIVIVRHDLNKKNPQAPRVIFWTMV